MEGAGQARRSVVGSEVAVRASETHAAPQPLTAAKAEEIWGNLLGGFGRASRQVLSESEQQAIELALEGHGVAREEVSFVGGNVFVSDLVFGAQAMLERLRASVEKGQVLARTVTQVIGVHDTSLVLPSDVVGAPVVYASRAVDGGVLFDRPEVDASFEHVLVLADDVPEAIFGAFRNSIAEIGNASADDCLSATFLEVLSRSEFDERFASSPFGVPPRVTEVVYAPEICGPRSLGCTQFPHAEDVVLTAPTPEGGEGTFQRRMLVGSFIGINSTQITPDSAEFSTLTHELLHALGLAHPGVETFAFGIVVAKLAAPGTQSATGGYPTIMALRNTADRTFTLSEDDVQTIATLYDAAPGCSYQSAPLALEAIAGRAETPDAGASDAGSVDAGSVDAGSVDAGASDAGADADGLDAGSVDAGASN